jgi:2-polyprenyl-3-methyl-5-hydroxy-6-metoxy-1,4-benzoquinol methylase
VVPTPERVGDGPRYDFEIDLEANSVHANVVRLVGERQRVLELGCATGYMSEVMRSRGCYVVGVELDPIMAKMAEQHLDRLIVGDLDVLDLEQELGGERFGVIVAADVLEHLKDPLRVLRSLRCLLVEDGFLIASIPNVAHGSVRLALLEGRFPYQERGLLDRTHLHFFTRESIGQLFEAAGFVIADLVRHELDIGASEVPFDSSNAPKELQAALDGDPDATTYQFVIKAFALEQPGMAAVHGHMRRLVLDRELAERRLEAERATHERELEAAQQTAAAEQEAAASLRIEYEGLAARFEELQQTAAAEQEAAASLRIEYEGLAARFEELQQAVAAIAAREGELRGALVSAHDQLLRRDDELNGLAASAARERTELHQAVDLAWRELEAVRGELELAQQERDTTRQHALELRVRLQRIQGSAPVVLYSTLKSLPGLRAVDARRTAGFEEALRRASQQP